MSIISIVFIILYIEFGDESKSFDIFIYILIMCLVEVFLFVGRVGDFMLRVRVYWEVGRIVFLGFFGY